MFIKHLGLAFRASEFAVFFHRIVLRDFVAVATFLLLLFFELLRFFTETTDAVDVNSESVTLESWLAFHAFGIGVIEPVRVARFGTN